ncbi:MAG TPA: hypothetical protein ENG83_12450 [Nitrospirae bacterium]|nr:hypothetical protein BMS3Abin06_02649 [bacterium BMS3Abin06]HDH12987.1 hypothetical protein [Nitrospirota bacterium]HDZ00395.1 hypothetical protein [Nitrospirota bacterium]
MANKCPTCGTIHDGWSCPICSVKEKVDKSTKEQQEAIEESLEEQGRMLEEQREAIESSIEDARMEMEYALEEAASKHQKTTSEAWKLQAEAKADRAYELYKANLYEEATKLCFEAISQDPGNILPYRYAAWSFEKLGQDIKSRELLKKQINLLKMSGYQNSQGHALKVLRDILEMKNNGDLMQSFLDASKKFNYLPADLLDELMGRSLYKSAVDLYFRNISTDTLSISGSAYGIELSNKSSIESVGLQGLEYLKGYLKEEPYTVRSNIFAAFKGVKESNKFSENTINLIRKEILKRYDEWKSEIKNEIAILAANQAKEKANTKSSPTVIGWIVGIISALFVWSPIGSIFATSSNLNVSMALPGLTMLAGSITTGIITSHFVRSIKRNNIETSLIRSMEKKEVLSHFKWVTI